jgi:hypothetical protein
MVLNRDGENLVPDMKSVGALQTSQTDEPEDADGTEAGEGEYTGAGEKAGVETDTRGLGFSTAWIRRHCGQRINRAG